MQEGARGCLSPVHLLLLCSDFKHAAGSNPHPSTPKICRPASASAGSTCLPPLPLQAEEEAGEALQIQLAGMRAQLAAVEEDLQAKDSAWVELQER